VVAGVLAREARRWLLPAIPVCVVAVIGVVTLVPSLHSTANTRLNSIYPVWDRQNQTVAALNMIQAKPLFGFGWDNWAHTAAPYFRLGRNRLLTGYPSSLQQAELGGSTGAGASGASGGSSPSVGQVQGELHDSYLSYAVELGLIGGALWLACVLWGLIGAAFTPDRDPELRPWRLGVVAIGVCFLVLCAVDPLSQNFTQLILWLWAGVATGGAGWRLPAARSAPRRLVTPQPDLALSRT
jgi:O-antigen ligase